MSISVESWSSVTMTGRRPINSGINPNFLKSSAVTLLKTSSSSSYSSPKSATNPMELDFLSLSFITSVRRGKAPPQIKRMLLVSTVVIGTIAFFDEAPTGTSISAPSKSFSIPCCTDSPFISRFVAEFFLASLSISSIKMMPCSAFSTSLSAAAKSLLTTDSMSSPMYPASVSVVASVIASGTSDHQYI